MSRQSLSQHLGAFRGPYLDELIVEKIADLESKIHFKHPHKLCWVIEKACWYYLFDINASGTSGWRQLSTPAKIQPWDANKKYLSGETVFFKNTDKKTNGIGKGIFVAGLDPTKGVVPTLDLENWICISDDSSVLNLEITGQSEFLWDAPKNRDIIVQVYEKTDSGYEKCLPSITYTEKDENTNTYSIKFFSGYSSDDNPLPYIFTGLIKVIA